VLPVASVDHAQGAQNQVFARFALPAETRSSFRSSSYDTQSYSLVQSARRRPQLVGTSLAHRRGERLQWPETVLTPVGLQDFVQSLLFFCSSVGEGRIRLEQIVLSARYKLNCNRNNPQVVLIQNCTLAFFQRRFKSFFDHLAFGLMGAIVQLFEFTVVARIVLPKTS